ncbi:MAG: peptidoglycan bridge formation glycyltransferase FemA/FemB family protein [Gemmatimonadota bacterium]|nr:peptidoglycan bridge formation glycyltransferase FemA/FemB family protein [Gemmatimonadota bacterium]
MTATSDLVSAENGVEYDPEAWDAAVKRGNGHLLQSWRWGTFKNQFGWEVERFAVIHNQHVLMAQVLFRHRAGVSIGYIPRGPVLPGEDSGGIAELWRRIDSAANRRRTLTIVVEPNLVMSVGGFDAPLLSTGLAAIQPARTVKVPLRDDHELLAQMHPKTRYNVRMAKRREVEVWIAHDHENSVDTFHGLLRDTAARNEFHIHPAEYYREFLRYFAPDAALLFAGFEGKVVAAVIAAVFGDEAIYMYGASSTKDRAHGAGFLLQHEAMRWARDRGARRYDLWGIPEYDPESTVGENGDRLAGSSGRDMRGLYEFKTRFGGEIVSFPPPVERRYHPFLASLARRFSSPDGGG